MKKIKSIIILFVFLPKISLACVGAGPFDNDTVYLVARILLVVVFVLIMLYLVLEKKINTKIKVLSAVITIIILLSIFFVINFSRHMLCSSNTNW